jgi:hypothetical protein
MLKPELRAANQRISEALNRNHCLNTSLFSRLLAGDFAEEPVKLLITTENCYGF